MSCTGRQKEMLCDDKIGSFLKLGGCTVRLVAKDKSGAEYVIIQIIEAYSKEVQMPREACSIGFGEARRNVQQIRLTQAGKERTSVRERTRQMVIFS